ncbi:hypothetical protein MBA34_19325 [Pseudomonas capeferrum]|uniref:hypothetical protein n=1 Tax=Pseudomonas capeferrum TaxID=1495066 RepID=UPI000AFBDA27|nr:hypothetical protein [Pseudomonas capeferrum]MCH7301173.1 hypothetical protein [Pseudomonas capeferrum]
MTNYQFCLILSLLFFIAANGVGSNGAAAIGYLVGIACGFAALVWCFLERKS